MSLSPKHVLQLFQASLSLLVLLSPMAPLLQPLLLLFLFLLPNCKGWMSPGWHRVFLLYQHSLLRFYQPTSQNLSPEHPLPTRHCCPLRCGDTGQATGHMTFVPTSNPVRSWASCSWSLSCLGKCQCHSVSCSGQSLCFYKTLCLTPHISSSNKFSAVHIQNPNSNQFSRLVFLPPQSKSSGIGLSYHGLRTGFLSPAFAHLLTYLSTGSRMSL